MLDYETCAAGGNPTAMMDVPVESFFGISTAVNQLAGWQEVVKEFYELSNNTPLDVSQTGQVCYQN